MGQTIYAAPVDFANNAYLMHHFASHKFYWQEGNRFSIDYDTKVAAQQAMRAGKVKWE